MRQHQMKAAKKSFSAKLKVVKGLKDQSETIETLVNTAWGFACAALWSTSIFSNKEIEDAKEIIRGFLIDSKNQEKAYSAFCQRVLLARQYISNNTSKYIPLPTIWLDKQNAFGFAGTKLWYDNIKALRSSLPQYKAELKAFAEAILEMKEYPTEKTLNTGRTISLKEKLLDYWHYSFKRLPVNNSGYKITASVYEKNYNSTKAIFIGRACKALHCM